MPSQKEYKDEIKSIQHDFGLEYKLSGVQGRNQPKFAAIAQRKNEILSLWRLKFYTNVHQQQREWIHTTRVTIQIVSCS